MSSSQFAALGLDAILVEQLDKLNFVTPTPVQLEGIPHVLEGRDVLAAAQTGTGKTAAFGLPIIQSLMGQVSVHNTQSPCKVKALVLVPTRELAQQVFDAITQYAEPTEVKTVVVYGGTSFNVQASKLNKGCDILIATPGRLLDHLFNKTLTLQHTKYLVLDEADRMLDMGFMPDIKRILQKLSPDRQTLFFSATFKKGVKNLAYKILDNPVEVEVSPANSTADAVEQIVYPVDKKRKRELLSYLIGSRNWQQVLVFTRTKEGAESVAKELKLDGIRAASLHGDKSQGARQRALDDFKIGKVRALVATDVAARGIDVKELEHVINFDMPYKAEDYIHRIGRSGRAGNKGHAVSLMSHNEQYLLEAIERLLDAKLPQEWLEGFEPSPESEILEETGGHRRSRSAEKRKMKAKMGVHKNRGKNRSRSR
ncbi:DEAD/DEAH box helicase [Vibrio breoganii]|uniref:DEAD/DEAH box helicase n=1 Tax=Vibrio breoganii TaxID=553239 RepID=UPI000C85B174|nr:DEAD/DEAH box helicase [Vibrio breoganii]PMF83489.1 DEAD/DEAH box helicase [Vibrio breoganii]PMH21016.1 DEAD/DEAH box helicase [Vibrio breoganii]PMM16609.1 DEAD/DEAH box helicase [Vibrio breoganii]TKG23171.1 DEAD/DEAH box helicase [Vibrio breoganii]